MTKEQIDKLCKVGIRKKFNAVELSQYITRPPYNLSVAEASEVYYAFKNRYATVFDIPVSDELKLEANAVVAAKRSSRAWKKMLKPGKFPKVTEVVRVVGLVESGGEVFMARTPSKLNRSSVKKYALAVSDQKRGGKFKRVSGRFVKQVEAEIENVIRGIGGCPDNDDIPGEWDFLNRKQIFAAVAEQLNRAVRKIILRKVRSYPSMGKTLK